MSNLKWRYTRGLKDINCFNSIKNKYKIDASEALKTCILSFNGGRPDKDAFDTEVTKEREMKRLLSFNRLDEENVYDILDVFKDDNVKLYPFAMDPAGNYICEDVENKNIIFYNHENKDKEYISKDFESFLDVLYE